MKLSQMTLLTLQWLEAIESASGEDLEVTRTRLVENLMSAGNTPDQVQHWLSYSAEMAAYEDETIESVMETEVILNQLLDSTQFS